MAKAPGKPGKPAPDPIDVAVGLRVLNRRLDIDMSQKALADVLGVSFQQVQKYEKGKNRVSASTLVRMAAALQTTVGLLVEEVEVLLPHGFDELLAAYSKAPDARRHDILRVVKIMAELR